MEASELNHILDQHKLWISTHGSQGSRANLCSATLTDVDLMGADLTDADLTDADLTDADLYGADLTGANVRGANLSGANLSRASFEGAIGLPNNSWIIPGCLVQLNKTICGFFLKEDAKWENFVQDSFGFVIQNNEEKGAFDMLVGDRIIRNIPDWVKYTGLKPVE